MTNTFTVKPNLAIDLSYYEPIMYERADYEKVNPKPVHVIARATYGVRQDTSFKSHWAYWRGKGVPVAAYHYWYGTSMYSGQTASEGIGDQAENFIKQIMEAGYSGKEPLWLDLEEFGNTTVSNGKNYRALVKQWLDHVERETGQKPGIYSRADQLFRMAISGVMPDWIHDHNIWLAWYPDGAYIDRNTWFPTSTKYRPSWLKDEKLVMWQYSDGGFIDGFIMTDNHQITTYDFNAMRQDYFESLETGTPVITEPPTEENKTMITAKINSSIGLRLRDAAPSGNVITIMPDNTSVEGDYVDKVNNFLHIVKVNGVSQVGFASLGYMDEVVIPDVAPPVIAEKHHLKVDVDGVIVYESDF